MLVEPSSCEGEYRASSWLAKRAKVFSNTEQGEGAALGRRRCWLATEWAPGSKPPAFMYSRYAQSRDFLRSCSQQWAGSRGFRPAHPTSVTRHSTLLPSSAHCTPKVAHSSAKSAGSPRIAVLLFGPALLRPCVLVDALLRLLAAKGSLNQPAKQGKEARPASCVYRKKLAANEAGRASAWRLNCTFPLLAASYIPAAAKGGHGIAPRPR